MKSVEGISKMKNSKLPTRIKITEKKENGVEQR